MFRIIGRSNPFVIDLGSCSRVNDAACARSGPNLVRAVTRLNHHGQTLGIADYLSVHGSSDENEKPGHQQPNNFPARFGARFAKPKIATSVSNHEFLPLSRDMNSPLMPNLD